MSNMFYYGDAFAGKSRNEVLSASDTQAASYSSYLLLKQLC